VKLNKKKIFKKTTSLISLDEDANQLNEVVIRSEKTTVEIKLDKKVYNVGSDLMKRTVSDVLDNTSVSVLRKCELHGNENVQVSNDGRPSNAINIAEAPFDSC
jgi:hypothetical protein